jgi:hypothetical protein
VTVPACRAGRWLAVLVLVALALSGCDRGGSPEQELRAAVDRTLAEDVAFEVRVRTEERTAAEADPDLASFLETVRVTGSHRTGGTYHLALDIGGTAPLLELRGGDGPPLLRTGLGALLGSTGSPEEALGEPFGDLDLDDEGRRALLAGFAGDWLALTDAADLDDAPAEGAEVGPEDGPGAGGPVVWGDLLEAVEVVEVHDVGGVRTFEVLAHPQRLQGSSLGRTLGGLLDLPATVPGRVDVRAGRVQQVLVDLSGEAASGPLELVLVVLDHGELPPAEPVDPVAALTVAELAELVEVLGTPLDDAR